MDLTYKFLESFLHIYEKRQPTKVLAKLEKHFKSRVLGLNSLMNLITSSISGFPSVKV